MKCNYNSENYDAGRKFILIVGVVKVLAVVVVVVVVVVEVVILTTSISFITPAQSL